MSSVKITAESDLRIVRHHEEAQADSSSSNWEKCARTLSLNTREELLDLRDLLQTLCGNIISNPGDNKYRTIKLNNKTLEKRLLNRKGGLEFLAAAGFKTIVVDAIRCLQLLHEEDEIAIKLVEIDDALDWLGDTVDTCLAIANSSQRCEDECCAECTIQLRLPTGATVSGGFAQKDLGSDILSFACCFFRADKYDSVTLRQTHSSSVALNEEDLALTLKDLELSPRAVLVVTVLADGNRAGAMMQSRKKVSEDIKLQKEKAEKLRVSKLLAKKTLLADKEKTLLNFQGDRDKMKVRAPTVIRKLGSGEASPEGKKEKRKDDLKLLK